MANPPLPFLRCPGGVPEWLNGAVSKTVKGLWVLRGFESHPLRYATPFLRHLQRIRGGSTREVGLQAAGAERHLSETGPLSARKAPRKHAVKARLEQDRKWT